MARQAPETMLLYGETDTGKTAQLVEIAKWHYARTGEISRAIVADSTIDPMRAFLLDADHPEGIIDAVVIRGMKNPWNRLELIARGYLPRGYLKPDGTPEVVMDAPKLNSEGKLLGSGGKVIGQYLVEGLGTISDMLLQDHADHAKERPMWGASDGGTYFFKSEALVQEEGDKAPRTVSVEIGRPVGGHYGSVQNWMLNVLIPRFSDLRSVSRVVWTGHTGLGKDSKTGIKSRALGPGTVGAAAVDDTSKKFGHTFHFEIDTSFSAGGDVKRVFKAWFVSHPDYEMTKINWPAKVSLSVERSREFLKLYPKGYIDLGTKGMEQWMDFLHPKEPKKA